MQNKPLTIAIPKGRIYKELAPLLDAADIRPEDDFFDDFDRKLMFHTNHEDIRIIRVRSFDVPTFVAFGGADIGVAGSDVLDEFDYPDIYIPLDLGIGKCRLSIAEPEDIEKKIDISSLSHITIATKYPRITSEFFANLGVQSECIKLNGAMELAPIVGLADRIVDLVSTGNTLKANGLVEVEVIKEVSSRLIVRRGSFKTRHERIMPLIEIFKEVSNAKKA